MIDPNVLNVEDELESDEGDSQAEKKEPGEDKKKKGELLLSNDKSFWKKSTNETTNQQNFENAIDKIRKKGSSMNIIDERLFCALNIPLPEEKLEHAKS